MKVSVTTTLQGPKVGLFAFHAMALPEKLNDSEPLATVIPDMERAIGNGITRIPN